MNKLYIVEYSTRGTSWYWAKNKQEAIKQAKEADDASNWEIDEAEIWTIDEAILNTDIINNLNRYILKPLKRQ